MHQGDAAVDGEPVGMHVERAHEDGDHEAAVMKIPVLVNFLHHHDLPVGRSHDNVLGVVDVEAAHRAAVEIEKDKVEGARNGYENPERYLCVDTTPKQYRYGYQYE